MLLYRGGYGALKFGILDYSMHNFNWIVTISSLIHSYIGLDSNNIISDTFVMREE